MNLSTTYLGLDLRTPLIVSANPMSEEIDNIKKMEEAGASAVTLFSLFEEQLIGEEQQMFEHTIAGSFSTPEALTYFPEPSEYRSGPDNYLEHIKKAKEAVDIPIIASLNCANLGSWTDFAHDIEQAGADALEVNIYNIPTAMNMSGADIENQYVEILRTIRSVVSIPIAVKLSPYFTNFANMARKLDDAGANGLVMFNRFMQPDINLDTFEVEPKASLSHSGTAKLPMRWIALIKGRVVADLAATGGIHTGLEVAKMVLAGANVTAIASAILKNGIDHLKVMENELSEWMQKTEHESVQQMMGSMSQLRTADKSAFERAQYQKALASYKY